MPRSYPSFRRRGFTLVELLVVIGIIALLIAILLPSLAGARRQAQLVSCLAKQRDIGTAVIMCANEHGGFAPLAGALQGKHTPEGLGDSSRRHYQYLTTGAAGRMAMWVESVATYMAIKPDRAASLSQADLRFLCPSGPTLDTLQAGAQYTTSDGYAWGAVTSYAVNEGVFGWNDALGRLRGRLTQVRRPTDTMLLMDGLPSNLRGHPAPNWGWMVVANLVPAPVTLGDALADNGKAGNSDNFDPVRHKNRLNILYMDGHAETHTIKSGDLDQVFLLAN